MVDLFVSLQFYENNNPHIISYYCIQIEITMEGDDGTCMSTMTVYNDDDPCSDVVLKPLKSSWDTQELRAFMVSNIALLLCSAIGKK